MKHLSDQDLMKLVQAGDFSPAGEIFDRYSARIYNFSIAANLCRDHLRKADNKAKEPEETLMMIAAPREEGPDHALEARENERRIQKALELLTAEQKEAILLSRYQGLSYAEIAQIAGCSEGAVKTRVFRAMETLKKHLIADDVSRGDRCLNAV
jgi:RNA polymerase sigma factor (sigma-70 family)